MPYFAQGGHSTGSSREAVSRMHVYAIFDLLLELIFLLIDKRVCVKDSSAEGTCLYVKSLYM